MIKTLMGYYFFAILNEFRESEIQGGYVDGKRGGPAHTFKRSSSKSTFDGQQAAPNFFADDRAYH